MILYITVYYQGYYMKCMLSISSDVFYPSSLVIPIRVLQCLLVELKLLYLLVRSELDLVEFLGRILRLKLPLQWR